MKKVLSFVLALVMVLGMTVSAFALESKTLSELLPDDFPTSSNGAWVDSNEHKCYKSGDFLVFQSNDGASFGTSVPLNTSCEENNGKWVAGNVSLICGDSGLEKIQYTFGIAPAQITVEFTAPQESTKPECNCFQKLILAILTFFGVSSVVYFLSQLWGF